MTSETNSEAGANVSAGAGGRRASPRPPASDSSGGPLRFVEHNAERFLILWFYIFIVAAIFSEVLRRFVLEYSSVWGEETARFVFIYMVWIAAALGVRERTHIRINLIMYYVPSRAKTLLYILGDLLTGALAIIMLYLSMHPVLTSIEWGSVTDGLRIGRYWFLSAVPLGFAVITLRVVQSLVRDLGDWRAGRAVYEGARLFE